MRARTSPNVFLEALFGLDDDGGELGLEDAPKLTVLP